MTNASVSPSEAARAQNAEAIFLKLQHAERALQEARRSILDAIELVETKENEPEFKTSTMKALIGSLDITSTPLGMEANAWDQYAAARRSSRF